PGDDREDQGLRGEPAGLLAPSRASRHREHPVPPDDPQGSPAGGGCLAGEARGLRVSASDTTRPCTRGLVFAGGDGFLYRVIGPPTVVDHSSSGAENCVSSFGQERTVDG